MQGCHTCRINCSVKVFKALGMYFSLSKMKNWLRVVKMEGGDQSNHELNLSHWKLKKVVAGCRAGVRGTEQLCRLTKI